MDMKRFTEITWQEAVVKWSNGEHVFSWSGHTYYMKDETLHFFLGSESNGGESTAFFNDITRGTWYVKKPFDVRAEMLARPNEWVGAFRVDDSWHKVGFDKKSMIAVETKTKMLYPKYEDDDSEIVYHDELDNSIPIEDVPKGEL